MVESEREGLLQTTYFFYKGVHNCAAEALRKESDENVKHQDLLAILNTAVRLSDSKGPKMKLAIEKLLKGVVTALRMDRVPRLVEYSDTALPDNFVANPNKENISHRGSWNRKRGADEVTKRRTTNKRKCDGSGTAKEGSYKKAHSKKMSVSTLLN